MDRTAGTPSVGYFEVTRGEDAFIWRDYSMSTDNSLFVSLAVHFSLLAESQPAATLFPQVALKSFVLTNVGHTLGLFGSFFLGGSPTFALALEGVQLPLPVLQWP